MLRNKSNTFSVERGINRKKKERKYFVTIDYACIDAVSIDALFTDATING